MSMVPTAIPQHVFFRMAEGHSLVLYGLPNDMGFGELKHYLSTFGRVILLSLPLDRNTGLNHGRALVTYNDQEGRDFCKAFFEKNLFFGFVVIPDLDTTPHFTWREVGQRIPETRLRRAPYFDPNCSFPSIKPKQRSISPLPNDETYIFSPFPHSPVYFLPSPYLIPSYYQVPIPAEYACNHFDSRDLEKMMEMQHFVNVN